MANRKPHPSLSESVPSHTTSLLYYDVAHSAEVEFRDTLTATLGRWVKNNAMIISPLPSLFLFLTHTSPSPSSFSFQHTPSLHLALPLLTCISPFFIPYQHISPFLFPKHTQVKNVYSETVTLFFIHMVDKAIQKVSTQQCCLILRTQVMFL